jgi:hypothetical protein
MLLLATLALFVPACTPTSASNRGQAATLEAEREQAIDAITREALTRGRSWEMLSELTTAAPKRLAGSEGAVAAVAWGAAAMQAAGFDQVRLEACRVPHWERGTVEELVIVAPEDFAGEAIPILALGGSVATPEQGLQATVIFVQSFEELHDRAEEARGKFVLFDRPMDDAAVDPFRAYGGAVGQRTHGATEAAKVAVSQPKAAQAPPWDFRAGCG